MTTGRPGREGGPEPGFSVRARGCPVHAEQGAELAWRQLTALFPRWRRRDPPYGSLDAAK